MNIKTIISLIDWTFLLKRPSFKLKPYHSRVELIMQGCTCHMGHPPCGFCTELTEEEFEIYATRGYGYLLDFVLAQDR